MSSLVLLGVDRLDAGAAEAARAACRELGLETAEWCGGPVPAAPAAFVTGLGAGERRVPDDALALSEALPAVRVVLCAADPMVKPRVELADGRVVVLGPPVDRAQLVAALGRATLRAPRADGRRFEAMRSACWVAWVRGARAPEVALDEAGGTAVVIGGWSPAIGDGIAALARDPATEAAFAQLAGADRAVIHLGGSGDWTLYWPRAGRPAWLCSPRRLPERWPCAPNVPGVHAARIAAFPGDRLVALWSSRTHAAERIAGGAAEVLGALEELAHDDPELVGVIVEAR